MKYKFVLVAVLISILSHMVLPSLVNVAAAKPGKNGALKNIPVTGTVEGGGTFTGTVSITKFGYNETSGLWVSGVLEGTVLGADGTSTAVQQSFRKVDTTLANGSSASSMVENNYSASVSAQSCDILTLRIGRIFLDLLGLQVDLAPIALDIDAIGGAGNLLGNLLCAVAGLLDPGSGLLTLIENLTQLLGLLEQINSLL